jgi:hypothetical protein
VTSEQFLARFPEFRSATPTLLDSVLDEASRRLNSDVWGERLEVAQGLLAAHLLWSSPFGASMRLDGAGNEMTSRYMSEFARLRGEVIPSMVVL